MPASAADLYLQPFALWSDFAWKTLQLSTAATQVVALRTGRMAAAGLTPDADDRRELSLMGSEKVEAFSRAGQVIAQGTIPFMAGIAGDLFRTGMDVYTATTRLAASRSLPQTMTRQRALAGALLRNAPAAHQRRGSSAAARLAQRALAPVHETATANAKRLLRAK